MIGDLLRTEGVLEEGFLISIRLTCSTDTSNMWFPTICGGNEIKRDRCIFGQAPQLAEILHIFKRYNLLTTWFGPTVSSGRGSIVFQRAVLIRGFPKLLKFL